MARRVRVRLAEWVAAAAKPPGECLPVVSDKRCIVLFPSITYIVVEMSGAELGLAVVGAAAALDVAIK